MALKSKCASKAFAITDIVKIIGDFKNQFERASDIEKLNNLTAFQNLVFELFSCKNDSGIIIRNENEDRLEIRICFHNSTYITIQFICYEKYKRIPYYYEPLFLDKQHKSIDLQYQLSEYILNDNMVLEFFK